jgi:hypothetical protein
MESLLNEGQTLNYVHYGHGNGQVGHKCLMKGQTLYDHGIG